MGKHSQFKKKLQKPQKFWPLNVLYYTVGCIIANNKMDIADTVHTSYNLNTCGPHKLHTYIFVILHAITLTTHYLHT